MIVCHCLRVTERTIRDSVERGCETVAQVTEDCAAGGGCGRCQPLLEMMLACSQGAVRAA